MLLLSFRRLFALALLSAVALGGFALGGGSGPAFAEPAIVSCEVGIGGAYKLGLWAPVRVEVNDAAGLTIEVVTPDNDGSPVSYFSQQVEEAASRRVEMITRVGRANAPVIVRLTDAGQTVAERRFEIARGSKLEERQAVTAGLSPTTRLVVEVTSQEACSIAYPDDRPAQHITLRQLADLPTDVSGYEAIDRLVISLENASVLGAVEADSPVVAALTTWVELGGRLVFVGATAAEQAFGNQGPLRQLAPGVYDRTIKLSDASPIERYVSADEPIGGGRRVALPVARLDQPRGRIELHGGGKPTDLPIVIRQMRGLGEVAFLAINPVAEPFASWIATPQLLARVAGMQKRRSVSGRSSEAGLVTSGYTDLSGALQQQLGAQFVGVQSVSMLAIVALVLAYLALIGPIDYYLLNRSKWRKSSARFAAAWITFPAMVLLFGGGAWWLAEQLRSDGPRVNSVELVDFDTATGIVRSTMWAQAYSPTASRHTVSIAARWPNGTPVSPEASQVTWLGLPGRGLGGLERSATALTAPGAEYRQQVSSLTGLPINVRSSKMLLAGWNTRLPVGGTQSVEAELTAPNTGVLEGVVVNNTGATLKGCWLVHGEWAWRLGDLREDAAIAIGDARAPIRLTTLVDRDFTPDSKSRSSQLGIDALMPRMMFTDALGGPRYTGLPNHFQSFTDLSFAVRQGRALLIARGTSRGSELLSDDKSWADPTEDNAVYYRFVLEVDSDK